MKEIVEIRERDGAILCGGAVRAKILPCPGARDRFEKLEEGAWKWIRTAEKPVDKMLMEVILSDGADFTMVPAVSYNGNGWGNYPEYIGDRDEDGTPWTWASHRVTIPACTYSENAYLSLALMSEPNDNNACRLYKTEEGQRHEIVFPEEEGPRTLQRHFWEGPFQGTMEPRTTFTAILQILPSDGTRFRYKSLMDFAWRYYGHPIKPQKSAGELYRLSVAFCRFLYEKEKDGFAGFTTGAQWYVGTTSYKKQEHRYQLGWVGQNASMANAFLYDYLKTGNKDDLAMALEAHDSWLRFGDLGNGLLASRIDRHPYRFLDYKNMKPEDIDPWADYGVDMIETMIGRCGKDMPRDPDGGVAIRHDACDLGTGADGYFEAYELLQKAGIDKPEYKKAALAACDFALANQAEDGSLAKSWDHFGKVWSKDGTVGCFLVLPLVKAWEVSGEEKYLTGAKRAFAFYFRELEENGFTTAGALDTYSIDKESASPLLRDALRLHEVTGDKAYLEAAEKIGWYLCTWMMHFTVDYPEDCIINKLPFDTFGSTSVSTPHQALDQYALRDVLSFLKLFELTGYVQWRERALAFWCAACQGISDGTLFINQRLRPAGSQDEAVFHTRWRRHTGDYFSASQWLPAWPCAFRLEALRWHEDWSFFDEGLTRIEGALG